MILRPIFTDNFNRADGTVGSNYTDNYGNGLPDIVSNKVDGTGSVKECRVTGTTPLNWNQAIQVTQATSSPTDSNIILWLRTSGTNGGGNLNGWYFQWNAFFQGYFIQPFTNSSGGTYIADPWVSLTLGINDTVRFQAYETYLSVWKNGTLSATYTSSTYATTVGSWGFGIGPYGGAGNCSLDDLICYDIYTGDMLQMFPT